MDSHAWLFMYMLGIWTHVLMVSHPYSYARPIFPDSKTKFLTFYVLIFLLWKQANSSEDAQCCGPILTLTLSQERYGCWSLESIKRALCTGSRVNINSTLQFRRLQPSDPFPIGAFVLPSVSYSRICMYNSCFSIGFLSRSLWAGA